MRKYSIPWCRSSEVTQGACKAALVSPTLHSTGTQPCHLLHCLLWVPSSVTFTLWSPELCTLYWCSFTACFLSIWHLVLLQICTGWSSMSGAACEALRHASWFDGSLHPLDVLPGGFSSASLCSCAHTNGNSWHLQTKRNPKQNGCPRWLLLFTIAALCCSITSVNAASELCFWWRFLSMAFSSIPVCFERCGVFHGLKDSFPFVLCYHHYPLPPHFALALQKLAHCRCSSQNLQATITPTQRSVPQNRLEDIPFTVCFLWVWCFSFI